MNGVDRKAAIRAVSRLADIVMASHDGTATSGSWQWYSVVLDGECHVVDGWSRDTDCVPMPTHEHPGTEVVIVVRGHVDVYVEGADEECARVGRGQSYTVKPGMRHAVTPSADCRALFVDIPPDGELVRAMRENHNA